VCRSSDTARAVRPTRPPIYDPLSAHAAIRAACSLSIATAYAARMDGQPPEPRSSRVKEHAGPLGLLAAAIALCCTGTSRVSDEDYDGVASMLDPIAFGACCGGAALLVTAVVVWWVTRDS
jgi:hypothetical protein